MSFKKIMLIIGLWVVFWIPGAGASQGQKEAPAKTPEGQILSAKEPQRDFQKARESFLKKNLKASAEAIRKGAASLKTEAEQATEKGQQALAASRGELEKLADRVEKGAVKSVKELDLAFARTYYALAQHHHLRATESWAKRETSKAGQELKAASTYLEGGLNRMGGKVETHVKSVIKNARLLAGQLIKGAGWVNAEVEKGIKDLGVQIDNLGKKVKPASK